MRTTTVVIGAGHAGLAASWQLAQRSIEHVVLERGEIANSWRTERWDSLTLLTPNWQSRLPGFGYEGRDPAVITDSLKCGAAAGHLGMSLDALAQQLAELEARGLIETCDKGLRLLDVDALERLVDGRE